MFVVAPFQLSAPSRPSEAISSGEGGGLGPTMGAHVIALAKQWLDGL